MEIRRWDNPHPEPCRGLCQAPLGELSTRQAAVTGEVSAHISDRARRGLSPVGLFGEVLPVGGAVTLPTPRPSWWQLSRSRLGLGEVPEDRPF